MKIVMPTRELEQVLWSRGIVSVAGIDEVGRGPLAGPVTVAAVVLPELCELDSVRDSKLLSHEQRVILANAIREQAQCIGIGWVSSKEIDLFGLSKAMQLAASHAISQLSDCDHVLLDGSYNYLGDILPATVAVKADQTNLAVAAASIVAKVARDNYMMLLGESYPQYGFEAHKGYGTPQHLEALREFGPSPHHRHSFSPVREAARELV